MFKLGQTDRFSYPVTVDLPGDGGKRQTYTFDAIFRRLSRDEFLAVTTRAQAGELDDAQLVRDVLLGWKGIQDEHGQELPFSEQAREQVLDVWPVLPAVVTAFVESHTPKGRAKN
jgi:hypothetical protein